MGHQRTVDADAPVVKSSDFGISALALALKVEEDCIIPPLHALAERVAPEPRGRTLQTSIFVKNGSPSYARDRRRRRAHRFTIAASR